MKHTRKDGERKFSMNQNLTVWFVFLRTLRIMIEAKRYIKSSYQPQNATTLC